MKKAITFDLHGGVAQIDTYKPPTADHFVFYSNCYQIVPLTVHFNWYYKRSFHP